MAVAFREIVLMIEEPAHYFLDPYCIVLSMEKSLCLVKNEMILLFSKFGNFVNREKKNSDT